MKLRLILGDQLNAQHSWYEDHHGCCYFMAEMRQETDYVQHHIQKVVAFFQSMRDFRDQLIAAGAKVIYYELDDPDNQQDLVTNLQQLIAQEGIQKLEYQYPDEYRLDEQLRQFCQVLKIETEAFDTEHFLTTRNELSDFFAGKKQLVMEYFYRYMRKKYDLLLEKDGKPVGGKWNYDQSNRKKWKENTVIPPALGFDKDLRALVTMIRGAGVATIGEIEPEKFAWPTNRREALAQLDYFCKALLKHFGDYQDAMHTEERFLYHSRLSFAMNSKILHPMEVIEAVVAHWKKYPEEISLSQVEGFVRQIMGWREYMRGIYWKEMPSYQERNALNNKHQLPDFFWTGETKMNCLHHAIKQSLDHAYAHHIQRLMVTGNFALLTQVDPTAVDAWYLGIYIDAIEWVEITNTRGMSQFADGGIVATKPYVSSGSYINKMSNYCKSCAYKVSKKTEEDACPFNALYWNFLDEKKDYFKGNQRMSMMMNLLQKMDAEKLQALKKRAQAVIANPDKF